jgi:hypothetical protein
MGGKRAGGQDGVLTIERPPGHGTTVGDGYGHRQNISPKVHHQPGEDASGLNYRIDTDHRSESIKTIIHLFSPSSLPLLIIAEDVAGEALATLVVNKHLRGIMKRVRR